MKVRIEITESGKVNTIEAKIDGCLSELAGVMTAVTTAAFEYPVDVFLETELAVFDKDGLVG